MLRNEIIWHKPNAMPSSCRDRFTVDFEKVFMFSKNKKYYFEQQFEPHRNASDVKYRKNLRQDKTYDVKEPYVNNVPYSVQPRTKEIVEYRNFPELKEFSTYLNNRRKAQGVTIEEIENRLKSQAPHHWFNGESFPTVKDYKWIKEVLALGDKYDKQMTEVFTKSSEKSTYEQGKNKRTVWSINTRPSSNKHIASYPEKLCETPILAGCPEFVCKKCGKAREKIYQKGELISSGCNEMAIKPKGFAQNNLKIQDLPKDPYGDMPKRVKEVTGLTDCGCNSGFTSGRVLDIFFGSGITGVVALKNNRDFIGIEINPEYIQIAKEKLKPIMEQKVLNF